MRTVAAGAAVLTAAIVLARRGSTDVTRDRAAASRTMTIRADGPALLGYFSDPERLSTFFHGLTAARSLDTTRQEWTFDRGNGRPVSIEIDVADNVPGKRFEWRTRATMGMSGGGSVTAIAAPGDRGTQLRLALHVDGRGSKPHAAFERLFGRAPGQIAQESLRNLKALAETGERPTAART